MNVIKELWHGNIIPQEDSRTNSKEMKELLGYTLILRLTSELVDLRVEYANPCSQSEQCSRPTDCVKRKMQPHRMVQLHLWRRGRDSNPRVVLSTN